MDAHDFLPCPPLFALDELEPPDLGFSLPNNPPLLPHIPDDDDECLQGASLENYPNPSVPLHQTPSIDLPPLIQYPPQEEVTYRPTDQLPLWSWESCSDSSSSSTQSTPADNFFASYPHLLSDDGMDVSITGHPSQEDTTAKIDSNFNYLEDSEISSSPRFFQSFHYLLPTSEDPSMPQHSVRIRSTSCSTPMPSYPPSPALIDSPFSSSRASPDVGFFSSSYSSPDIEFSSLGSSPYSNDLETETNIDQAQLDFGTPFGMEYVPSLDVESTLSAKMPTEYTPLVEPSTYFPCPLYCEANVEQVPTYGNYETLCYSTHNGEFGTHAFGFHLNTADVSTAPTNFNCENDGNSEEQYHSNSSDGYAELSSSNDSVEGGEYCTYQTYYDHIQTQDGLYFPQQACGNMLDTPNSPPTDMSEPQNTTKDSSHEEYIKHRDYYKLGMPVKAAAIGKLPPRPPPAGLEVAASRARARASLQPVPAIDYVQQYRDMSRLLVRKAGRPEDYVDTLINKSKVIRLTHHYQQQIPIVDKTTANPAKKRKTKREVLENSMFDAVSEERVDKSNTYSVVHKQIPEFSSLPQPPTRTFTKKLSKEFWKQF